jgi:hypothetical protein
MSKLNPQKASAYVGPGVLRKGGKITPVPNGPLVKKKGIYAGSTLKAGGKIKKAQNGEFKIGKKTYTTTKAANDTIKKPERTIWVNNPMPPSKSKNEFPMPSEKLIDSISKASIPNFDTSKLMKKKAQNGNKIKKAKAGAMIKRADGSMSRRGLWDNIRANKGSGKKPTKQMLVQEKKIKAKTKK